VSKSDATSIVVAHVTYSWPEAEVVCGMLNAAGVPAILADRNTIGLLWHQALAFGGFRILVYSKDYDDAKDILSEFAAAKPEEVLPETNAFWRQPIRNFCWLFINYFFGIWCPAWLRKRRS
jgi:Putative prokaryotic signal transducing protein